MVTFRVAFLGSGFMPMPEIGNFENNLAIGTPFASDYTSYPAHVAMSSEHRAQSPNEKIASSALNIIIYPA